MSQATRLTLPRTSEAAGTSARISLGRLVRADSSNYVLLLGTTIFLVLFGLVMVLSASSIESWQDEAGFFGGFWKQATYAVVGIPLMLVMSRFPITFWKRWAWPAVLVGMGLQLLVFTPLGIEDYGNRNWIHIGSISGQPSEFVKLALVVWLGAVLARKQPLLDSWKHAFIPVVPVAGLAILFVMLGHDLGTVIIMSALVLGAMFFANVRLRHLFVLVALGGVILATLVMTSSNRMARLKAYAGEECTDYQGLCWQPIHGTWALANGGVFGVGLGNSHEKWEWLPAASNDYIFAIIGEELGLLGCVVLLGLFIVLAIAFIRIMRASTDPFARITTGAVMVWIIGQGLVNIAVVLRLLPVLGVPLPLISSGGTALLTSLMAIGIVLSFARSAQNAQPHLPVKPRRERTS